ncbi:MAG: class I SAM-dependent methyltransferase [Sandaracinaceae bacterium]
MSRDARLARYQEDYARDYGYEARLVEARGDFTARWLAAVAPARVVEVGCGSSLLFDRVAPELVERWVVAEPAARFAEVARARSAEAPQLRVVQDYFERAEAEIAAALEGPADVVIIDSLLHEIPDAQSMLGAARRLLAPAGRLYVSVPNAYSLHRRLARAMGLIEDEHAMSQRNVALAQARVYDAASLREEVCGAGFEVLRAGGHTLKPFTNAQMEGVEELLGDAVLRGLASLGEELPELAAEIFVEARVSDDPVSTP